MGVDHPFAIVPLRLLGSVSASAVCVYAVLAEAANQKQEAWPSKATIGDRTGLSARTVQRCIAELRDAGWIKVWERSRENGSQTSNTYLVMRVQGDTDVLHPEDIGVSPPETLASPPEPDPEEPDPLVLDLTPPWPQPSVEASVSDPFDAWWDEYPRKVQKPRARKAYATAAKKTSHDRLMDAMRRYRDHDDRVARGFVLHPATWLNQECWEDELVEARQDSEEAQWALLKDQMGSGYPNGL
jgi:hypothetical protein